MLDTDTKTELPAGQVVLNLKENGMGTGSSAESIQLIRLNKIKVGENSRMHLSKEALDGLMQSIKEEGLLQPIGVAKTKTGYEVCYGNRRFLAVSKLGWTRIPCVVHNAKSQSDLDVKNLAENIQRSNISLAEAGRYIELLQSKDLNVNEVAVRLGVSRNYVDTCLRAFREVPEKFRKDLDASSGSGGRSVKPGKISLTSAKQILNARRTLNLNNEHVEELFAAAKKNVKFNAANTVSYGMALQAGKKNFVDTVDEIAYVNVQFRIPRKLADALELKYVANGPFRGLGGLIKAIVRGEKSVSIKLLS